MPRWHLVLFSICLVIVTSSAKKPSDSSNSESSSNSISSSESISENSTCFLPNCRKCDILDLESCTCTPVFVKCAKGFIFDEETCNCIESSDGSTLCPGLKCPKGQHINEARCECTKKICQTFAPCPSNTILDLETCECICNLDPNTCPDYYIFDDFNCLCRHPNCDPPSPCPGRSNWDTELCQCKCSQQNCTENFIFDTAACDCVSIYSTEPSTTEPQTTSELTSSPTNTYIEHCDPPGPCPGLSSWNSQACACICAVKVKCFADFIFNEKTCQCENPFGTSSYQATSSESESPQETDQSSESSSIDSETETEPESSTEVSIESSSSCNIPDCRWCDWLDPDECYCYRMVLDCGEGYMLDDEGCRCLPIPDYSSSTECSETIECSDRAFWNQETCDCQCMEYLLCDENYSFDATSCECVRINEPTESLSSSCYIPDCRPCDFLDTENCECYRNVVDCPYGYQNTEDGCSCEPIPGFSIPTELSYPEEISTSTSCEPTTSCPERAVWNQETCKCEPTSEESTEPSQECSIPDCRWCDYLDVQNCECYKIAIDCLIGYELSSDGCTCNEISLFSSPSYEELSSETEGSIPSFSCLPTSSCPDKQFWNYETCSCECVEQIECDSYYELNLKTCECEAISMTSESSECSIPDCRWCDYLDLANCECQRLTLECMAGSSVSKDGCSCIPPETSPDSSTEQESSESITCSIPDCRWCDYLDYENCICHKIEILCMEGYQISNDGCSCLPISIENSTPTPSVNSPTPCFIESCRWCDIINIDNCTCQRAYVDCALGFELSSDGCSCVKSTSTSANCPGVYCENGTYIDEISCKCLSENSSSSTEYSSSSSNSSASCSLPYCRPCDVLDTENCVCHKIVIDCSEGFKLSDDECSCEWVGLPSTSDSSSESVSSTSDGCGSSPPPYCRWCDHYDAENCICHMRYVDCFWGYELSPDGCTCIESNVTSNPSDSSSSSSSGEVPSSTSSEIPSNSSSSSFSSTDCSLPYCRPCDVLDVENCVCHKIVVDCFQGYELSEDGCECVKSYSTSENCPGIYCNKGTYIDEIRCECINDECRFADPCPGNLIMDAQTCECFCHLNPSDCSFPYTFDYDHCKCRHPPCDPPGPCPNKLSWDPENCKCRCIQSKACDPNYIFDSNSCDCVCDPKMMNTTCPSGSVFDSLLCDCVEEIDCYDFNDPACECACEEILECSKGKEFDLDYCECMCPYYEVDPCPDGFVMSEEICDCVKKNSEK